MINILTYKNVTIARGGIKILEEVCFSVVGGEIVYITGRIGCGKSTLLKSIYADIPIAKGEANFETFDLTKIPTKQIPYLRRKLGIIFQDTQLLTDRNVAENLKFVLEAAGQTNKKIIKNTISEMLNRVDLQGKELKMPYELSGGEQQCLMIARAMLNNPSMLIADEPTGNLDQESSYKIMELLRNYVKKGGALIIATHNLTLLQKFPARNLMISEGKLLQN